MEMRKFERKGLYWGGGGVAIEISWGGNYGKIKLNRPHAWQNDNENVWSLKIKRDKTNESVIKKRKELIFSLQKATLQK
jgi:hypothetical protein